VHAITPGSVHPGNGIGLSIAPTAMSKFFVLIYDGIDEEKLLELVEI
jgi:hypothetical protein